MAQQTLKQAQTQSDTSVATLVRVLLAGMYFGIVLVKSEVVRWERINQMFLFQEAHMYLIIVTAIVVGIFSMLLIRRFEVKSVNGVPIKAEPKPFQKGVMYGGLIFGMGWAITGACPGPIYAQIGGGAWPAFITFISAFGGMYLYGWLRPKLPH